MCQIRSYACAIFLINDNTCSESHLSRKFIPVDAYHKGIDSEMSKAPGLILFNVIQPLPSYGHVRLRKSPFKLGNHVADFVVGLCSTLRRSQSKVQSSKFNYAPSKFAMPHYPQFVFAFSTCQNTTTQNLSKLNYFGLCSLGPAQP
jgi:hypothetical protein